MLFVYLFVYFARVGFCPFSLPLGVRDWLRLVIVALPGLGNLSWALNMFHGAQISPFYQKLSLVKQVYKS